MKKALSLFGQFLIFLFFDGVGSLFYHPFGIATSLRGPGIAPRSFVWDGLILMLIVYLLVLVVELIRKRIRSSAPWSTLALVLAALAGYFLKFGFVTHNW